MNLRSSCRLGLLATILATLVLLLPVTWTGAAPKEAEKAKEAAGSCPMYGGTIHRNLVNLVDKNIPGEWSVKKGKVKNVKWSEPLGNMAYGGPVISGGKIFVGTNNEKPRDPAIKGDKGIMMCFEEATGKFLWQAVHDKLDNPDASDTPKHGVASVPVVEGNRIYYVSNRCALVCADTQGSPDKPGQARILWTCDFIKELGVFPCYLANSSPLIVGDLVFALTANGVDPGEHKLIAPKAASFVAVNKNTGKVAWKDASPGNNIMEGQWSNPVAAEVNGQMQVIYGAGDGWLRGFEAATGNLVWKFDCNPKKSVYKPGGRGDRSYIVATPVIYKGKLYVGTGNDPEDGSGVGHLWCIDIGKKPANMALDLSPVNDNFDPKAAVNKDSGLVWHYGGPVLPAPMGGEREVVFGRTISTMCIVDDLVYAAELAGYLHCLDANTGKKYWEHDFQDSTWNSPYYVDGKIFLGADAGDLYVFTPGKQPKKPTKIDMENQLKVPPIAVNGVLYVNNGLTLYAIAPAK